MSEKTHIDTPGSMEHPLRQPANILAFYCQNCEGLLFASVNVPRILSNHVDHIAERIKSDNPLRIVTVDQIHNGPSFCKC